ncbi:MAG: PAS domain-containing protein [Xanthobacteraceae bacterium]
MEERSEHPTEEIKRLERCVNDLVSLLALPAVWSGGEPSQIVRTLLDVLLGMLRLDLVYVRLKDPVGEAPVEVARVAQSQELPPRPEEIGDLLTRWLGPDPQKWAPLVRIPIGDRDIAIVPLRLGLQGEIGAIVAGSRRADFPRQTESLVLTVAANQAAIGLHEARLLSELKRVANELDQRVAQRTAELAAANEELKKEVAERRQAEEDLRAIEVNLRQIVDSIPGLVCTVNPAGEIEHLNRQVLEYFGKTQEEMKSWATNDAIHPDDRSRVIAAFTNSIATGTPYDIEQRCRRADGVYRWFQNRALPVRDADGGVTGWYILLTDIDDRKRAEEELRRSEAFLAEGQRVSLTGSFSWRMDPDEITFSEELYRIFEFEHDAPVTLERIGGRVHPEDIPLLSEKVVGARNTGSDHDYEIRLRMPDGSVKYLHTASHAIRHPDGRLEYIGAVQDVTQRRLSEEALANVRSELAHVTRVTSLGVLTASIAHEVNQPLAAIITNAETGLRLLARPDLDAEKVRVLTKRVVADARRASEIIDRVRAMATGRALEPTLLSLDDVIGESMVFLRHEFRSKGVSISLDLAPALPQVVGDRTQLQQVVVNLAINAVQAMAQSEAVRRSIFIRTMLSDPETVCCNIEDSGPGIDPSHLPRLFDNFFTTKSTGMGMGLAISRSIIEAHAGRILADNESALGGARFSFALPANTASAG